MVKSNFGWNKEYTDVSYEAPLWPVQKLMGEGEGNIS